jgi:RNA-directed DNA polymerase
MSPTRSQSKQDGAATPAATEPGAVQKDSGSIGLKSSAGELADLANADIQKVLNEDLMERVLMPENLKAALKKVKANKGAPGIDGMTTDELDGHLRKHWPKVKTKIEEGTYRPAPLRPKEIEKSAGKTRQLGIPTVLDRFIQQAVKRELEGIFDPTFSEHSYGYRPNRSAHQAVKAAKRYVVEDGRNWVIDIDIKSFFDHIDHDILMRMVAEGVGDKRVLKLLGKFLRAGVLEGGKVTRSAKGSPQGAPISPLLANIYLDILDKEMESRGLVFCRFADDITIYATSERSAKRNFESIVKWIERNLKLEVNREKSGVRPPDQGSFLGFRITEKGRIALSEKSITKFKNNVREIWSNPNKLSGPATLLHWQQYVRGWIGYFRLSEQSWDWEDLEGWIRRHIRKWFWLRWHNWKGRRNAFKKLGVKGKQLRLAHSSRGAWPCAMMLNRILRNQWLRERGFWTPSDLVEGRI